jgi:hypothetical protein
MIMAFLHRRPVERGPIRWRWLPTFYWRPAPADAVEHIGGSVWDRWEVLCLGWGLSELMGFVFRRPDDGVFAK